MSMVFKSKKTQKVSIRVSLFKFLTIYLLFISVIRSWKTHESSVTAQPPQDFIKINKLSVKMGATGHISNKDFRKNVDIRKKMKQGGKQKNLVLPEEDFAYGLANPPHEDIADLIYNTYGNRAEEMIKKDYEDFIAEKSKIYRRPKVVPRFISPKVEEMKKKEEERKANMLDAPIEEENVDEQNKEPEKPLYKLKMFQNVGSKVTEGIKKFKTYKPFKVKHNIEEENNGINKIINDVQEDVKQREQVEQPNN